MTDSVTATKKLMLCGSSLVVNLTFEAKTLGLERGDIVKVIIERPDPQ